MNTPYDSPSDIDSVALKIRALSYNDSPKVYANGRNRLPIEINATAMDKNDKILTFSHATWIQMLSLCFSESKTKLARKGTCGWCFTDEKNDYAKEIDGFETFSHLFRNANGGQTIIILYVYTDVHETRRISVCLDTAAGTSGNKHFTTNDMAYGSERAYVKVVPLNPLNYRVSDLDITFLPKLNPTRAKVHYHVNKSGGWIYDDLNYDRYFDCHYDNYYIGLKNNNTIKNVDMHAYGSVEGPYKWIAAYDSNRNNQHMIVVHPFNAGQQTEEFGFDNSAHWKGYPEWWSNIYHVVEAAFHLKQNVTYNAKPNQICLTQMAFLSGQQWELPDNCGLDIKPFYFDNWFELYDEYGNYGRFCVKFTDDHSFIKIEDC